jgi:hypothetical protein
VVGQQRPDALRPFEKRLMERHHHSVPTLFSTYIK